jgi:hypothetical protein
MVTPFLTRSARWYLLVGAGWALTTCYSPTVVDCSIRCGPGAICPNGTVCSGEFCRPPDAQGSCPAGSDAGPSCPNMNPDAGPSPTGDGGFFYIPICSKDNWCWQNPLPQGNQLNAAWGLCPDDLWAVGGTGTALHWDGQVWTRFETNTPVTLQDVFGTGPSDVWAVGAFPQTGSQVATIHWDGEQWVAQTIFDGGGPSNLSGVWETSLADGGTDVWIVGASGSVFHNGSGSWQEVSILGCSPPDLNGIWGSSETDIWAVADNGQAFHWNGCAWQSYLTSTTHSLDSVWGTGAGDVWAVGVDGIQHWTGVWTTLTSQPLPGVELHRVRGTGPSDVWASGDQGSLVHWNGSEWSVVATPADPSLDPSTFSLRGLVALSPSEVWAVGLAGVMFRWNGNAWSRFGRGATFYFNGVWGNANNDVWAVGGKSTVLHWDGSSWTMGTNSSGIPADLESIWGWSANDIWAVGAGGNDGGDAYHWTGSNGDVWSAVPTGTTHQLNGVAGSAPNDVWAVGGSGTILHWDGGTWTTVPSGQSGAMESVWAGDSGQAWTVNALGQVLEWNGSAWAVVVDTTDAGAPSLHAVTGTSAADVWAVGENGTVLHFDGTRWTSLLPVTIRTLFGACMTQPGHLFAVGGPGELLEVNVNATSVTQPSPGTLTSLRSIWAAPDGGIWVVGDQGVILYQP